ncbi:MAG TPA: flagellar protein FlgN [Chthoniobacterales bacterium]|jgi:flagellar biosynthesis/type III secretory pathway chaperone
MITDWECLVQPLRDELQEHGALLNLFEEQQAAILGRQPDLVLHIAEAINKQVAIIRDCHKRRKASVCLLAREAQCPESTPLSALIPYFPGAAWPLLRALVSEVNRLVKQTKRRARQNQMLLARTIEVSQEILQRLNPGSLIKTYSPEGRVEVGATAAKGRVVARS